MDNRCTILLHYDNIISFYNYISCYYCQFTDNDEDDHDRTGKLTVFYDFRFVCTQTLCETPRHRRGESAKCVQLRGQSFVGEGRLSAISGDLFTMESSK